MLSRFRELQTGAKSPISEIRFASILPSRPLLLAPIPRSAYIHVPFCRHRCGYCNFSVVSDRDDLIDRYLDAIDRELAQSLNTPPPLDTLFIGGGTPTHLPLATLDRFLGRLRTQFTLDDVEEWSVEANPEDITDEKLRLLTAHGVNRLSLGVQSFRDEKLRVLERGHRGTQARRVVEQVAEHIENVSVDLIFAAPGETLADWKADLEAAASLPIQHVSTYALTFEKGTSFWSRRLRGDLHATDEGDEIAMYDLARKVLGEQGLLHYEVSNFGRPGRRCLHNLAYWRGDGWYAAGPGAAGFVDLKRTVNHRSTTTYLKRIESGQSALAESEPITPEQWAREKAAFGVRMIDGVDLGDIRSTTKIDIEHLCSEAIRKLTNLQMITADGGHLQLTANGLHFADSVAAEFL
ncbi:MAG: radical SAM family heme chaperone HemW [Planctomycetota bacterium]